VLNFQRPESLLEPPRWAERANGLGTKMAHHRLI